MSHFVKSNTTLKYSLIPQEPVILSAKPLSQCRKKPLKILCGSTFHTVMFAFHCKMLHFSCMTTQLCPKGHNQMMSFCTTPKLCRKAKPIPSCTKRSYRKAKLQNILFISLLCRPLQMIQYSVAPNWVMTTHLNTCRPASFIEPTLEV